MNLDSLYGHIGNYDCKLDCLLPMYLCYPEMPVYKVIQDEGYFMPRVLRHFEEVQEPEKGDLLIFKFSNGHHFGIYAGNDEFFHACKTHKLRLTRFSAYKKYLKGVYRWFKQ